MWPTSWRCCSVRNISWQISQHSICQGLINPQSQLNEKYFLGELFLIQEAGSCCHQPYWAVKRSFQGMKLSILQPGCSFDSLRRQYLILEMLRNLGYDISPVPSHPGCAIKLFLCNFSSTYSYTIHYCNLSIYVDVFSHRPWAFWGQELYFLLFFILQGSV